MNLEFAKGRFDTAVPEKFDTPFYTYETSYGPIGLLVLSEEGPDDGKLTTTTIQVWATDFSVSGKVYTGNLIFGVHPGTARFINADGEYHIESIEVQTGEGKPAPAGVQAKFREVAGICFKQASQVPGMLLQALLYRRFNATKAAKEELDEIVARVQALKERVETGKVEMKRIIEMIGAKTPKPKDAPTPPPPARATRK